MPGDREKVDVVGDYILELYIDPLRQRPRTVIEINTIDSDGNYYKVKSVWFNPEGFDERVFENPENGARKAYDEMCSSEEYVESHLD